MDAIQTGKKVPSLVEMGQEKKNINRNRTITKSPTALVHGQNQQQGPGITMKKLKTASHVRSEVTYQKPTLRARRKIAKRQEIQKTQGKLASQSYWSKRR